MDIIDLPGLVATGKPALDTKQLAKRYLDSDPQNSIFIVAEQAGLTRNNWQAMHLIKENRLEHRSIGVFTKADKADTVDEITNLRRDVGGQELEPYGFVATVNKPHDSAGARRKSSHG